MRGWTDEGYSGPAPALGVYEKDNCHPLAGLLPGCPQLSQDQVPNLGCGGGDEKPALC